MFAKVQQLAKDIENKVHNVLKSFKGVVIGVDGRIAPVNPANGTDFVLSEAKSFVDGHVEIVRVIIKGKEYYLICNENGYAEGLPGNVCASLLYCQNIVGNVLVCHTDAIK